MKAFDREPAVILGGLQAGLVLAASFGLNLTPEQMGAISASTAALLALWTRSKVSPAPKKDRVKKSAPTSNFPETR